MMHKFHELLREVDIHKNQMVENQAHFHTANCFLVANNRAEHRANVFLKDSIKYKGLHNYQCSSGHSPPRWRHIRCTRSIRCSCMFLVSVSSALFKFISLWDEFKLDCIRGKEDQLFKYIGKFRYLGMEDLSQEVLIENCSVNIEFLENKPGEITAGG